MKAIAAKMPNSAVKKFEGGWVPTNIVRLNSYKSRDEKLKRILENPEAVLSNQVEQHAVVGVWDPIFKHFVLRNGNHRLRVAVTLKKKQFYIHTIRTAGDMGWKERIIK